MERTTTERLRTLGFTHAPHDGLRRAIMRGGETIAHLTAFQANRFCDLVDGGVHWHCAIDAAARLWEDPVGQRPRLPAPSNPPRDVRARRSLRHLVWAVDAYFAGAVENVPADVISEAKAVIADLDSGPAPTEATSPSNPTEGI